MAREAWIPSEFRAMKLFSFLLGNSKMSFRSPAPVAEMAPGTEISYDPNLVAHFTAHHRQLVSQVGKLRAAASSGNYDEAAQALRKFRTLLYEHLLEENVRLYTYLSYCLQDTGEGHELMTDMRREMGDIGRAVTRFIKAYTDIGINAGNVAVFVQQLDDITVALADRIEREERSLYTLYLPPSQIRAAAAP